MKKAKKEKSRKKKEIKRNRGNGRDFILIFRQLLLAVENEQKEKCWSQELV